MKNAIIISDRNPNIRKLMLREISPYKGVICQAKNIKEVQYHLTSQEKVQILILDPDLPGYESPDDLMPSSLRHREMTLIIHTNQPVYLNSQTFSQNTIVIEKTNSSIGKLSKMIFMLLSEYGKDRLEQ